MLTPNTYGAYGESHQIRISGHSFGGGLAATEALYLFLRHGYEAQTTTMNAAGAGVQNLEHMGIDTPSSRQLQDSPYSGFIRNYRTPGDPITRASRFAGVEVTLRRLGVVNPYTAHKGVSVLQAMQVAFFGAQP